MIFPVAIFISIIFIACLLVACDWLYNSINH